MIFLLNTNIHYRDTISVTHNDNVPPTCHGVNSFHIFKMTVKDQNWL